MPSLYTKTQKQLYEFDPESWERIWLVTKKLRKNKKKLRISKQMQPLNNLMIYIFDSRYMNFVLLVTPAAPRPPPVFPPRPPQSKENIIDCKLTYYYWLQFQSVFPNHWTHYAINIFVIPFQVNVLFFCSVFLPSFLWAFPHLFNSFLRPLSILFDLSCVALFHSSFFFSFHA